MESKAKVAGHPVHPMLVAFPIALFVTAVAFDVVYLVSDNARWTRMSWSLLGVGIVLGIGAAVPGWIDWQKIPQGTRAKRIGLIHGVGNVVVLGLFTLSWLLRREAPAAPETEAVVAGLIGAGILLVTGWLGGELIYRLGVSVDDGAHLDSPSSLSELPAGVGVGTMRAGMSRGYSGVERRHFPQAAYAGVERRGQRR